MQKIKIVLLLMFFVSNLFGAINYYSYLSKYSSDIFKNALEELKKEIPQEKVEQELKKVEKNKSFKEAQKLIKLNNVEKKGKYKVPNYKKVFNKLYEAYYSTRSLIPAYYAITMLELTGGLFTQPMFKGEKYNSAYKLEFAKKLYMENICKGAYYYQKLIEGIYGKKKEYNKLRYEILGSVIDSCQNNRLYIFMRNDYSKLKIRVTKSWDGIKGKK